jgi:uncharacterized protein
MKQLEISPDLANALGHYVYAYVDPRDNRVFYVGKGVGGRAISHLSDRTESQKAEMIYSIKKKGLEPRIDIVAHDLKNDAEAARVEAACIELIGVENLTNIVRGLDTSVHPRKPLLDFIVEFKPIIANIIEPSILIRINQRFKYGMTAQALYEATRGMWIIGKRRIKAKFAMPVYAGVIREVYRIESWHQAGTTLYETRAIAVSEKAMRRWEFLGSLAENNVRRHYVGYSVKHLFKTGQQNPIIGVNLEDKL